MISNFDSPSTEKSCVRTKIGIVANLDATIARVPSKAATVKVSPTGKVRLIAEYQRRPFDRYTIFNDCVFIAGAKPHSVAKLLEKLPEHGEA